MFNKYFMIILAQIQYKIYINITQVLMYIAFLNVKYRNSQLNYNKIYILRKAMTFITLKKVIFLCCN